ncbi:cyclin-L2 isoform X1 [Engystomops pustulosus]|uniref:cyclin-L2 isoform X1 n=2 Tax=Engystomops pustulosus TaxID=76066 RepID=UPI003AFAD636
MAAASTGPSDGILIGDKMYSGVLISLENCLIPEDKCVLTPSMVDGLDFDTETDLRCVGCELIQSAGILLRLPQVAMATGQVLFQRFFYSKSYVKHSMEHVSMACIHLASKIEEAPRRIRDVINVFHRLRQLRERQKPAPLVLDQEYVNLKNQIIKAERRVLKELGFCVHVKHPHKIIVMYLQVLECERNKHLVQTSWNYMNDSLRTDVFVRFNPETIACACIYLAARTLEICLPNRPHWFLLFGASEEDIQDICLQILRLYSRKKADLSDLESKVEKQKLMLEEAKAKAKGLLPDGTPRIDNAPEFSPNVKSVSPKEGKSNKPSPVSIHALKNVKRKVDDTKRMGSSSPVNGVTKGRESRSGSGSRDQSYSRSHSRSVSPKRRKSESYSTSSGSKSRSHSRSRSDSPPRKANLGSYKSSKSQLYGKGKDYKYTGQKRRSRSRSSSPHSRSRGSPDSGKYKKKSHYYRERRRERSRSYERVPHRHYDRDYPGHSHHRR